jgi:hypothetical protein
MLVILRKSPHDELWTKSLPIHTFQKQIELALRAALTQIRHEIKQTATHDLPHQKRTTIS